MRKAFVSLFSASILFAFSSQVFAAPPRAVGLWWVIFNQPQNCITNPGAFESCGAPDVFGQAFLDSIAAGAPDPTLIAPNLAADIAVIFATGGVTNARGKIRMIASIYRSNPADVPLNLSGGSVIDPLGLGNAWTNPDAEVHLVVRDHGRAIRKDLITQLVNFLEPNCSDPNLGFVAGPNICRDVQDALFAPGESGPNPMGSFITGQPVPGATATLFRNGDNLQIVIETTVTEDG